MDIINSMSIGDQTKINYISKYKKVKSMGTDYYMDEKDIIKSISVIDDKPNNVLAYLNVLVSIRKFKGLPIIAMQDYRSKLIVENSNKLSITNQKNLDTGLPSVDKLIKYTELLYEEGKWKYYIINYLLLMVNCRNKDLNCMVSVYSPKNETDNYLILSNDKVEFIRNDYKTKKIYGSKRHEFIDKAFIYGVKQFLGENKEKLLLTINKTVNISKAVAEATYERIGSGRYNKIFVREASIDKLIKIGKSRGTSLNILLDNYYIDRKY